MPVSDPPPLNGPPLGTALVDVRLLGAFDVRIAGRPVRIGSAKQRAVLALLALRAGRIVTTDALCDVIWDDDQPASPAATLQSLISRMRAALATASEGVLDVPRDVLRTREPGWVLDVDPDHVDALRFQKLTARARRRSGQGDNAGAGADLAEALALWRGAALVDVVGAGYLSSHATRLNEARLNAVEDLAEAELALGHPAEALARLEDHVDANPLRERGWGLLMVALYRMGRQSAALRTFQQVRTLLRDELGLEPSPELVEIEQRILGHDAGLGGPSGSGRLDAPVVTLADRAAAPPAAHPPAAAQPGPPARVPGEFGDYSVIVVEDHDFQRRTVVQLLRGLGVGTVTDASNGTDALDLLQRGPEPDIMICDIDMPGMDGVELVAQVAERNLACALVIASGLESNVVRAVEAIGESHGVHVLAAMEKPLTARRLGDVLRQYTRVDPDRAHAGDKTAVTGEEVRSALDDDALTPQFEPRIDLATGAMSSAAASGRWRCPDGRAVPSSVFLPALEREGLLLDFVERVIAASSVLIEEVARTGVDRHASLRVALNVSPLPLADASLAARLADIVHRHGQEPRRFVWELDDVVLVRARAASLALLTRLRVKGFGLSMSHTGTGPGVTNQLERVPLSELRLDRRLVSSAAPDPKRLAALEAVLGAAQERGLPVVADGCDSRADFDMLVALGCSEAQGRFVADPMDADEVVRWAVAGCAPGGVG